MSAPIWYQREIFLGDSGQDVDFIRRKLLLAPGVFDIACLQKVNGIRRRYHLEKNDSLDYDTAILFGESEVNAKRVIPEWFENRDEDRLRALLAASEDANLDGVIRRWQGSHGFPSTGVITEIQALMLGE